MSKNPNHHAAAVGKETKDNVLAGVMRHLGIGGNKGRENGTGYPKDDRVKDQKGTGGSAGLHHAAAVGKETKEAVEKGVMRNLGVEIIKVKGECGICSKDVTGSQDRVKDHKNIYYHVACWNMKHPGM